MRSARPFDKQKYQLHWSIVVLNINEIQNIDYKLEGILSDRLEEKATLQVTDPTLVEDHANRIGRL